MPNKTSAGKAMGRGAPGKGRAAACVGMSCGVVSTAVIGPRGQVVIPKEARNWLGISPGDQIVFMSKHPGALVMLKAAGIRELAEKLLSKIS